MAPQPRNRPARQVLPGLPPTGHVRQVGGGNMATLLSALTSARRQSARRGTPEPVAPPTPALRRERVAQDHPGRQRAAQQRVGAVHPGSVRCRGGRLRGDPPGRENRREQCRDLVDGKRSRPSALSSSRRARSPATTIGSATTIPWAAARRGRGGGHLHLRVDQRRSGPDRQGPRRIRRGSRAQRTISITARVMRSGNRYYRSL